MPDLTAHRMNLSICREQVRELDQFLKDRPRLGENQITSFFRKRLDLTSLTGLYNNAIVSCDRLAWEYPLFGDFQCDLVVGDYQCKAYAFVEFEDASPGSLFVQRAKKRTREWSRRFENGYSQGVDWFYKLHTMTNTPEMEERFGKRAIEYTGILVAGRD